jgi:hypothetical protein
VKFRPSFVVIFLIFSSSGYSYYYLGIATILAFGFITSLTFLEAMGAVSFSILSAFTPWSRSIAALSAPGSSS